MDLLILTVISFLTSGFTAVVGIGGGFILLTIMVDFLPPIALIPIHGFIQLSSNASRAALDPTHIKWDIVKRHAIGVVIGATIGALSISIFPFEYLPIVLGLFVLLMTWSPYDPRTRKSQGTMLWVGAGQTYLSFFVGATGPMSYPLLLRRALDRHEIVVTHAVTMVCMHLSKVIGYGTQNAALLDYWDFMVAMSIAAVLGSFAGKRFRHHVSENRFRWTAKVLLTVLSVRLILKFFIPEIP